MRWREGRRPDARNLGKRRERIGFLATKSRFCMPYIKLVAQNQGVGAGGQPEARPVSVAVPESPGFSLGEKDVS